MDVNGLIYESIQLFSGKKYAEAIEILHQAWDEITDKSTRISEQCLIQTWLGCCYFEQAKRTKDEDKAEELFGQAIKHFQERFELHKQLTDGNEQDLTDQIGDQFWLGSCYLEQAKKTEDTDKAGELFGLAVGHYQQRLQLAKQLTNEQNGILQQISAQSDLGRCYLEQIKRSKSISEAEKFVK
jgi:UDP-N-acetylglucosamine-peptide-n-acetylglucosaminyltransferase